MIQEILNEKTEEFNKIMSSFIRCDYCMSEIQRQIHNMIISIYSDITAQEETKLYFEIIDHFKSTVEDEKKIFRCV